MTHVWLLPPGEHRASVLERWLAWLFPAPKALAGPTTDDELPSELARLLGPAYTCSAVESPETAARRVGRDERVILVPSPEGSEDPLARAMVAGMVREACHVAAERVVGLQGGQIRPAVVLDHRRVQVLDPLQKGPFVEEPVVDGDIEAAVGFRVEETVQPVSLHSTEVYFPLSPPGERVCEQREQG